MKEFRSGWTLPFSSVARLTILVGLPSQTQSIWNRVCAFGNAGLFNCAGFHELAPSVETSTFVILP